MRLVNPSNDFVKTRAVIKYGKRFTLFAFFLLLAKKTHVLILCGWN